jgi:hypothetical protein
MNLKPKEPGSEYQYGEKNFRRFEPQILQVLREWPAKITFNTVTVTPCSWRVLFRAACSAFVHEDCHWTSEITKQEIYDLFEQLVISPNDAKRQVSLYPKNSTPDDTVAIPFALSSDVINVRDDETLLHALLLIKDRELSLNPLKISGISLQVLEAYRDIYQNVSFAQDEPGVLTVF